MTTEHPNFPVPKNDSAFEATREELRSRIGEHLDRFVLVGFDEHGTSVFVSNVPDEASRIALNRIVVRAIIPPNHFGKL